MEDLPREPEERDPPVVEAHPPVPHLKDGDHHPSLQIQKHHPRSAHDVAEALSRAGVSNSMPVSCSF